MDTIGKEADNRDLGFQSKSENIEIHTLGQPDEIGEEGTEETPQKRPIEKILFIDDEEAVRSIFKDGLERCGYSVEVASNGQDGLKSFRENPSDLIITDIFMPEQDGHAFIYEILKEFPDVKIFAITGNKSFDPEMELDIAQTLGAVKTFAKPVKISRLLAAIKELSL